MPVIVKLLTVIGFLACLFGGYVYTVLSCWENKTCQGVKLTILVIIAIFGFVYFYQQGFFTGIV